VSGLLHGGVAGLAPGDYILPAARTGQRCHDTTPNNPGYTPKRVYVTSGLDYAQMFAYLRDGAVYEVLPVGQVRQDEDTLVTPSWSCRRALILRVVVPAPAPMPTAVPREARAWLAAMKARAA
jgi:hypothetical protein